MVESAKEKVVWLQYVNTTILSLILGLATMIAVTLATVKTDQAAYSAELIRIKTIQDINTGSIKDLDSRVSTLELNYLDYIKTWVDQNYIRKPQK